MMKEKKTKRPDWGELFAQALSEPGRMSECYSLFHSYSLGNQALAIFEMQLRGIPIGPIASFNGWKKIGRKVKKGEKAIALWMPFIKRETKTTADGEEKETTRKFFIMKNNWFAFSQTEPLDPENPGSAPTPETPSWDKATALENLGITEEPFAEVDGNTQGYAKTDLGIVAINPLAAMPWKTLFHEIAHCLMHSKETQMADGQVMARSIKEAEAESVAYLCCATLGLPGTEESRSYIQDWLVSKERSEEFAKKSAARVFAAADKILKSGAKTPQEEEGGGHE